jgi:hypothetical protein
LEEVSEFFTAERVLDWLSEALLLSVKTGLVFDDLRSVLTLLLFSELPSRTPELEVLLRVACEPSTVRFTSPFLLLLVVVPSARAEVVDVRRVPLSS